MSNIKEWQNLIHSDCLPQLPAVTIVTVYKVSTQRYKDNIIVR